MGGSVESDGATVGVALGNMVGSIDGSMVGAAVTIGVVVLIPSVNDIAIQLIANARKSAAIMCPKDCTSFCLFK